MKLRTTLGASLAGVFQNGLPEVFENWHQGGAASVLDLLVGLLVESAE